MPKGCRKLTDEEVDKIKEYLSPSLRNKTMFLFFLFTGMRVSEALSIRVSDVWKDGIVSSYVYLKKCNTKKQVSGRSIPLNEKARAILKEWIDALGDQACGYLFFPPKKPNKRLTRFAVHHIFKAAFDACGLSGKLACHSTRKTFCGKVYRALGKDLINTQIAMGHKSVTSTQAYLEGDNDQVNSAFAGLDF